MRARQATVVYLLGAMVPILLSRETRARKAIAFASASGPACRDRVEIFF